MNGVRKAYVAVDTASSAFGAVVPAGAMVLNKATGLLYILSAKAGAVDTLTTATKAMVNSVGGSDGQVQYNSSGILAGSSSLTFNVGGVPQLDKSNGIWFGTTASGTGMQLNSNGGNGLQWAGPDNKGYFYLTNSALTLKGGQSADAALAMSFSGKTMDLGGASSTGWAFRIDNLSVLTKSVLSLGDTATSVGYSSGAMELKTSSTARITIASGGNIGVGTANAYSKIALWDRGGLDSQNANETVWKSGVYYSSGDKWLNTGVKATQIVQSDGSISLWTSNDAATGNSAVTNWGARLTINPDGKVGIGTVNAGYPLDVNGVAKATGLLITSSSGGGEGVYSTTTNTSSGPVGYKLNSGWGNWSIYNSFSVADAMEFRDESASAVRMLIDSTGRIGIGISDPQARLQVGGVGGTRVTILSRSDGESIGGIGAGDMAEVGGRHTASATSECFASIQFGAQGGTGGKGGMLFKTSDTDTTNTAPTARMTITADGKVGIGTTSPDRKLNVFSGTAQISPINNGGGSAWFLTGSITDISDYGVALGLVVEDEGNNGYGMKFGTKPNSGTAITERMRIDKDGSVNIVSGILAFASTQVLSARKTGWSASTGTATRTAFATSTATTEEVAQRLKALIDDLISHGLIGA